MRGVTWEDGHEDIVVKISTRTPHAGSDYPLRQPKAIMPISTRTPHAGSDRAVLFVGELYRYFNPHSPCGE